MLWLWIVPSQATPRSVQKFTGLRTQDHPDDLCPHAQRMRSAVVFVVSDGMVSDRKRSTGPSFDWLLTVFAVLHGNQHCQPLRQSPGATVAHKQSPVVVNKPRLTISLPVISIDVDGETGDVPDTS